MKLPLIFTLLILVTSFSACKKDAIQPQQLQEIPVKNEWDKLTNFHGYNISSVTTSNNVLLMQTNKSIGEYKPGVHFIENTMKMPFTNANIRIPITKEISVIPNVTINPTTHQQQLFLRIFNNVNTFSNPLSYFNYDLNLADDKIASLNLPNNHGSSNSLFTNCLALNNKNQLLMPIARRISPITLPHIPPTFQRTFMLVQIETNATPPLYVQVTSNKTLSFSLSAHSQILQIAPIDNYFLVSTSGDGVLKVYEDGSIKKVFNTALNPITIKANGKIFAAQSHASYVSTNDGETFTRTNSFIHELSINNFYNVQDSLISFSNGKLITLNWDGTNVIRRQLESKLIGHSNVSGINVINNTVYLTTVYNGIFTKPLSQFFKSN